MKKNRKLIAPLALGAAGALAAGIVTLLRKAPKADAPAPAAKAAKPAAALKTGSYSFVSGFQDAATVEMQLDYDPERFSFDVISEDFLSYSSDSHVAVVYGEEFRLQLEYASYYSGEDFDTLSASLAEKYRISGSASYGAHPCVWVLDGDNVLLSFPIPDDAHSYLLVTVQKTSEYDDEVTTLVSYPPLQELLETLRFRRS